MEWERDLNWAIEIKERVLITCYDALLIEGSVGWILLSPWSNGKLWDLQGSHQCGHSNRVSKDLPLSKTPLETASRLAVQDPDSFRGNL